MRNPLQLLARPRAAAPEDLAHLPVPYVSRSGSLGRPSYGGTASPLSAMANSATVYPIVDLLANSCAQVEWHLYLSAKSGKDEDRTEITDHPALTLWERPNPFMTRALFMESVNQHYELTGAGAMVIYKIGSLPVQLWPCRPDRLEPVPHPTKFLAGWRYVSPDGEKIPLGVDEVLWIRTPNPENPYGSLGPFGALATDLDSSRMAALWNRNFFTNSAEPGGVVEAPNFLDDEQFQQLKLRWNEQHRGVAAAHRVAILEGGLKWVDRSVSHKDMTFVDLDRRSDEKVMLATRVSKPMLGITEDVNRANAEAAELTHARWQLTPRLQRWKQLLNVQLLPMFGATGKGREFDFEDPAPEDEERAATILVQRATAAKTLIDAGLDRAAVLEACELPEMVEREGVDVPPPAPVIAPPMPAEPEEAPEEVPEPVQARAERIQLDIPKAAGGIIGAELARLIKDGRIRIPQAEQAGAPDVNLDEVQAAWENALAALMAEWGSVLTAWQTDLVAQVRSAIDSGKLERLTKLSVDSDNAAVLLAEHMTGLAVTAAERVVSEARREGVHDMEPAIPKRRVIDDQAAVTAGLLAADLAIRAGREAMRVQSPDLDGNQVADKVAEFLAGMSDASTKSSLGGALTGAQNQARIETFKTGPVASLYANEKLDSNTCAPCKAIDGRYIGSTADGVSMGEVERLYPMGGYVDCLGRDRCRGTVTGVWRPVEGGGD